MCRHLSKYAPIFLLALSGLIFLLRNILTLENLSFHTKSMPLQPKNSSHTAFAQKGPFPLYHNHTYCSLGLEPTPDEALEERYLLNAITWPKLPARPVPVPLSQTSDPVHSLFTILPSKSRREWHVGDQLETMVQMHDFQGRSKSYGGDFLVARLHSPELGAGVGGMVVDHLNGSYSALFPLLWEGTAQVVITMVHSSEAVAVLQRLEEQQPDRFFFKSLFSSGNLSETTMCNICLPPNKPLCDYTDIHHGEPWFCLKPTLLSCDTRINHASSGVQMNLVTEKEALLFQSLINLKVVIHASGPDQINVLPKKIDEPGLERGGIIPEPVKYPSGYYYRGSWRSFDGTPARQFNDSSSILECLTDKVIHMYGDSTTRKWFEYLRDFVPELKVFDLHSSEQAGPCMAVDFQRNIMLKYRCHGPPLAFYRVSTSELRYVANELDGLPGGPHTVVVIGLWAHFSPFPVEFYIRRMRHIRRALVRLLDRGPGTLVVIRSANLRALEHSKSLFHSDWYALQRDRVLRHMFMGLGVVFMDALAMTLAHHLPHNLHPPPAILKIQVDVILSHVCPAKNKS